MVDRSANTAGTAGSGPERVAPVLAASGLLGALLASSCCLLPMTLVSLGLGGAWLGLLAPLAPWQPWFVGLAVVSLALGFWLAYRPAPVCAADGSCPSPRSRTLARAVLWVGAALLVAAITFEPLVLPLIWG
jgi:mercuric ion transport protein